VNKTHWWLGFAAVCAPAAVYLGVLAHTAINVPNGDDYLSILQFMNGWIHAVSRSQKLSLLFGQYFSHRIVLTRCAVLAEWHLAGCVDFLKLQKAGWIAWIALTGGFIFWAPAARRSPWFGLPLALWFMQPQGFTNLVIGMQAVQNIGVVLLAFAALAAAQAEGPLPLTASLLLSVLAPFTSINGFMIAPAASLGLWISGRRGRALAHAAVWAAMICVFFHHYAFTHEPFSLRQLLANAGVMAFGFADFSHTPLSCVIAGGLLLLAAAGACLLRERTWRLLPVHASFLLFCLLSVGLAAAGRIGWGADYMVQDRYRLYGLFIAGTLFLLALESADAARQSPIAATGVVLAAFFCLLSYARFLPNLITNARWCEATAIDWQLGSAFPMESTDGWRNAALLLAISEKSGIYRLPEPWPAADLEKVRLISERTAAKQITVRISPNGGVDGSMVEPVGADEGPGTASWALISSGGKLTVLPRAMLPARLPDLLAGREFFRRAASYILPDSVAAAGWEGVRGIARSPGDGIVVAWEGTAGGPILLPESGTP
jgi:hypothetical protein